MRFVFRAKNEILVLLGILFSLSLQQTCTQDCTITSYFPCKICYKKCFNTDNKVTYFNVDYCEYQDCGQIPSQGQAAQCDAKELYVLLDFSCVARCCESPSTYNKLTSDTFEQCIVTNDDLLRENKQSYKISIIIIGSVFGSFFLSSCICFFCPSSCFRSSPNNNQIEQQQVGSSQSINARRIPGQAQSLAPNNQTLNNNNNISNPLAWHNLFLQTKQKRLWDKQTNAKEACTICLEHQCNAITSCFHVYHENCIREWLRTNISCPNCKYKYFNPIKVICESCRKKYFNLNQNASRENVKRFKRKNKIICQDCILKQDSTTQTHQTKQACLIF